MPTAQGEKLLNALYVVARMTVAYFMFGYSLVMYTICIEIVGPSARSKANFMYFIYGLGNLIMSYPLASVWGSNWRVLEMACFYYTALCMLPTIFLIPESFRWQLVKGKPEQARVLIHKIAKKQNETQYDESHLDELIIRDDNESTRIRMLLKNGFLVFFF